MSIYYFCGKLEIIIYLHDLNQQNMNILKQRNKDVSVDKMKHAMLAFYNHLYKQAKHVLKLVHTANWQFSTERIAL